MRKLWIIANPNSMGKLLGDEAFSLEFKPEFPELGNLERRLVQTRPDLFLISDTFFKLPDLRRQLEAPVVQSVPKVLLTEDGRSPPIPEELLRHRCLSHVNMRQAPAVVMASLRRACEAPSSLEALQVMGNWIHFNIASDEKILESVKQFIELLLEYTGLPRTEIEGFGFGVKELLLNALEHGNHFDPAKKISVSYVLFMEKIIIKIEDEGCGFLHGQIPDPLADPAAAVQRREAEGKRPGGYGIAVARRYVDAVEYNDMGNVLILTKKMP